MTTTEKRQTDEVCSRWFVGSIQCVRRFHRWSVESGDEVCEVAVVVVVVAVAGFRLSSQDIVGFRIRMLTWSLHTGLIIKTP